MGIEPINRFETYFINRGDQALALAEAVGAHAVGAEIDQTVGDSRSGDENGKGRDAEAAKDVTVHK